MEKDESLGASSEIFRHMTSDDVVKNEAVSLLRQAYIAPGQKREHREMQCSAWDMSRVRRRIHPNTNGRRTENNRKDPEIRPLLNAPYGSVFVGMKIVCSNRSRTGNRGGTKYGSTKTVSDLE